MKYFFRGDDAGDTFEEDDILGRLETARGIKSLISSTNQPVSILLDGNWGSGKSTFLRKLGALMDDDFHVIKFDAFALDYHSDAFVALTGEIIAHVQRRFGEDDQRRIEFITKSKKVARVLFRVGTKVATAGVLSATDLGEIGDEIVSSIGSEMHSAGAEILQQRENERSAFQSFGTALSQLQTPISSKDVEKKKKIVILIDELDRCRPDFALDIIEKAKHFFNVDGVSFLFALNRDQFSHAVCGRYGSDFDATTYLQKFFEIEISLTYKDKQQLRGDRRTYVEHLFQVSGLVEVDSGASRLFASYLTELAERWDLSLRDIEKVLSTFLIAYVAKRKPLLFEGLFLMGFAFLKVIKRDLFKSLQDKNANVGLIFEAIKISDDLDIARRAVSDFNQSVLILGTKKVTRELLADLSDEEQDSYFRVTEFFTHNIEHGVSDYTRSMTGITVFED